MMLKIPAASHRMRSCIQRHQRQLRFVRASATRPFVQGCANDGLQYNGWCPTCSLQHAILPDEHAVYAAQQLMLLLNHYKRFDYEVPHDQADPCFSTDYVWTKGPGRMMGVLVATDPNQGNKQVALKAFSGQMTERWDCPGWAGPVAAITSASEYYKAARKEIEGLSAQMSGLESSMNSPQETSTTYGSSTGTSITTQQQRSASPATCSGSDTGTNSGSGSGSDAADVVVAVKDKKAAKRAKFQPKKGPRSHWPSWAQEQYQLLVNTRKHKSYELIEQVQRSYHTFNLSGAPVDLLQAYYKHQQSIATASDSAGTSQTSSSTPEQPLVVCQDPSSEHIYASTSQHGLTGRCNVANAQQAGQTQANHADRSQTNAMNQRNGTVQQALIAEGGQSVLKTKLEGFPAGTGDCCAPKLLHAAAQRGLVPVSMVEFWYGSPPSSNTPQGNAAAARRRRQQGQQTGQSSSDEDAAISDLITQSGLSIKPFAAIIFGDFDARTLCDGMPLFAIRSGQQQELQTGSDIRVVANVDNMQASRVHGCMYTACEKCRTILGAMLCDQAT